MSHSDKNKAQPPPQADGALLEPRPSFSRALDSRSCFKTVHLLSRSDLDQEPRALILIILPPTKTAARSGARPEWSGSVRRWTVTSSSTSSATPTEEPSSRSVSTERRGSIGAGRITRKDSEIRRVSFHPFNEFKKIIDHSIAHFWRFPGPEPRTFCSADVLLKQML